MNPASFNSFANGNDIDLDMSFYTLEEAIDMAEFQESLVIDEDVLEEMIFEEEV